MQCLSIFDQTHLPLLISISISSLASSCYLPVMDPGGEVSGMSESDELPTSIEKSPTFKALMAIFFGIGFGVFAGYNLYRWYLVG